MRVRARRELVDRRDGRIVELLEHEQLRAAEAGVHLGLPGGFAQRLHDAPDGIQHLPGGVRG